MVFSGLCKPWPFPKIQPSNRAKNQEVANWQNPLPDKDLLKILWDFGVVCLNLLEIGGNAKLADNECGTTLNAWLKPPDANADELKKRTLTNLYNARPAWLAEAHRKLDEAVFAAYGWPATLTDAELLERLLALNHQRAVADGR